MTVGWNHQISYLSQHCIVVFGKWGYGLCHRQRIQHGIFYFFSCNLQCCKPTVQLFASILTHCLKTFGWSWLGCWFLRNLVISGCCGKLVTELHGFVHITHVFIHQLLTLIIVKRTIILHGFTEFIIPCPQFVTKLFTDGIWQHRLHEIFGYVISKILRTLLHIHQTAYKTVIHGIEWHSDQALIKTVGQFFQFSCLLYIIIQLVGNTLTVTSLTGRFHDIP